MKTSFSRSAMVSARVGCLFLSFDVSRCSESFRFLYLSSFTWDLNCLFSYACSLIMQVRASYSLISPFFKPPPPCEQLYVLPVYVVTHLMACVAVGQSNIYVTYFCVFTS